MDRLSKKCVITSGIVHGTLVLVLIVGPAFLGADESKFDPKEVIDFIPFKTIDQSLSGGGNQLRQPFLRREFDCAEDYPQVNHVHFFGAYIGNFPDLETNRIKALCELLNSI